MASSEGRAVGEQSTRRRAPRPPRTGPRRARLARGPIVIGEPAPAIDVRLAGVEPYRPDTIADGGSAFGLEVRAASVRGLLKRYAGQPRQDDLCLRLHEPTRTLIAAVADGVSAASRSDLGAALAVRQAAAAAIRQLEAGTEELDWAEVFDQAAWALVEEHRRHAGEPEAAVEAAAGSLATTLLVAAVRVADEDEPGGAAAIRAEDEDGPGGAARVQLAAVGDSPALVLKEGAFDAIVGDPQDEDGLLGAGVASLPRAQGRPQTSSRSLEPGDVLLLCTDGLALPLAGGENDVGRVLARELSRPPDVIDFARMLDFSRSTYDDDRTLVAVWAGR
jgi:serine/threonine protein phosphatase PrpC